MNSTAAVGPSFRSRRARATNQDCEAVFSLSTQLKQATREQHIKVESAQRLKSIFSCGFDAEAFRQLLLHWHSFFHAVDSSLAGFGAENYRYLARSGVLATDLLQLSIDVDCQQPIPYRGWMPTSFHECLGAVYVIEGSSLGAKIITKHLRRTLGTEVEPALNFYQLQPYDWASFRQWLDRQCPQPGPEVEIVVESAKQIFNAIYDHMSC